MPNHTVQAAAEGLPKSSAPRLNNVSDHLSEAVHILEAIWMAAADISQGRESEAIRTVLHLAQRLVEGARDDVDAYPCSPTGGDGMST